MADHASSKIRIRRNARRAAINGARTSRIRTFGKKVEFAIAAGDMDAAQAAFKIVQPELQRGVTKGVMHKKTMSRKLSRMSARIKAMKTA